LAKYLVRIRVEVNGIVEKHDIIGAIFGQTEGLFGEQFDLKALQEKGRIGRILINSKIVDGKTVGEIVIPSNLDRIETALLIAMLEQVERVGPYEAKIKLIDIVDVRLEKIKRIVEKAEEILKTWSREKVPDLKEILKQLEEKLKIPEPIEYGPEKLPAGTGIDFSDTVIIVEGRADVINLLRYGYTNVIAIGGAKKIPNTIKELAKKKKIIAFIDGDHAGDLILKELLREVRVDYITRAPPDKEVEDLTLKEIEEALKNLTDTIKFLEKLVEEDPDAKTLLAIQKKFREEKEAVKPMEKVEKKEVELEVKETITIPGDVRDTIKSLHGTLEAVIYSSNWNPVKKIPVRDLVTFINMSDKEAIYAVVFDGIVTQRLVDAASEKGVKVLIGAKIGKIARKPENLLILTFSDIM